ncbi:DUF3164 family protein [Mucilaginibacter ximonensis]|uniref:DUF3164 family protein n=1 Tax=Mucilaginibacter ximonensis TaxID=538021 RepID=A0ABW5YGQ1_9SPHI
MNLQTLTPEEKKTLLNELAAEQKAAKKKKVDDREALKTLMDEAVVELAPICADFGQKQEEIIQTVFNRFASVIALKKETYGFDEKQSSHTFTARDGKAQIIIGYNEIIGFDNTVDVGLQKIHEFISSLSVDDANREKLQKIISTLTKKNKKGDLNPTKVIALSELKAEMDNDLFTEGVEIVEQSQFKTRTTMYVRGYYRKQVQDGREISMSFSITA